jgi:pyroglutamyl-peptidase
MLDAPSEILTKVNIPELCNYVSTHTGIQPCASKDAGLYLCEFTYFTSLVTNLDGPGKRLERKGGGPQHPTKDAPWVLFMHVPPIGKPYTLEQLQNVTWVVVKYFCEKANV